MKKAAKAIWKSMCWFDTIIPNVGVVIMGAVLFAQIIFRYLLKVPLTWSDEFARFTYVWVTFTGLSYCLRNHTNIRMQAVLNVLPARVRKRLLIALNILSITVFAYLLPYALEFAIDQFKKVSPALAIPKGYISIAVPIGFFLLIINLIIDTVKMIKMAPEEVSISESH